MIKTRHILIISANPMSKTSNNGKTIASFFDGYPQSMIAQLYFSSEPPERSVCQNFFRISDMDMLRKRTGRCTQCGEKVQNTINDAVLSADSKKMGHIPKGSFSRIIREFIWNDSWKSSALIDWLNEFKPDIIFFVGGDGIFAYKVCFEIMNMYSAKLAFYLTDDYILPRWNISLFWWIRRNWIYKYMKKAVDICSIFITISPTMQEQYREWLGKDSLILSNLFGADTRKFLEKDSGNTNEKSEKVMIYAGGLHFNRIKVLIKLSDAIRKINQEGHEKIRLEIYSTQKISPKNLKKLNAGGNQVWKGGLTANQTDCKLRTADYLVHVESFDYKSICSTKLSLSTKIPEYMSYKKPIIAIGPPNIASMQYLKDCSCCITNSKDIVNKLADFLQDSSLGSDLSEKAYKKYLLYHSKEKKQAELLNAILRMVREEK